MDQSNTQKVVTLVSVADGHYPDIKPLSTAQIQSVETLWQCTAKLLVEIENCAGAIEDGMLPISLHELVRAKRHASMMVENIDAMMHLHECAKGRSRLRF